MSITIKDVARQANVSVATVSRVLNNLPGYSEDTKKKVLGIINDLGYQPNAIARGLINKKTKTIGVLLPNVSNLFAADVLAGIEDIAHEMDYSVVICKTDKSGERTLKYLQMLREKQVDGILFVSEWMKEEYYEVISRMSIPVVLVSTKSDYPLPYVKVNDFEASYDAVNYLLNKGHRNIGMIAGTEGDLIATSPRVEGFKKALLDEGIDGEPAIVYGDFAFETGITGMEELIEKYPDVTAVFCASDEMAVGALSYLYKKNIRVPDQIAVVGYDNTSAAEKAIPPLTTVGQPLYEMGRSAAEMLLKKRPTSNVVLQHKIIERETVK
ncbi:LacI family DNA-binding transcriptional regulator [Priestia koreensis]|uniref:LacI family DNA-binding transcriptional regulator n=1 Tax=Priestia koreensis TaxID=284581 RepID=UPI001F571418|nr:LacI family DNA-binding transcriptional regulator [Priestia koreensis]UNL84639.1 LacI family DNA-binding transcriptional regulator [Priestia koreensis]